MRLKKIFNKQNGISLGAGAVAGVGTGYGVAETLIKPDLVAAAEEVKLIEMANIAFPGTTIESAKIALAKAAARGNEIAMDYMAQVKQAGIEAGQAAYSDPMTIACGCAALIGVAALVRTAFWLKNRKNSKETELDLEK